MKHKVLHVIVMFTVISFVLSGCSLLDFFSADNLLKAPKLTGENAALQRAFEEAVGKDVSLFTPISGENRASYVFFDANNDGNDEAIVFYSLNSNLSVVHMHLLSANSEKWYSVADMIGSGTGVYKVDFFNLDGNSDMEIAVSWTADDSQKEKKLSIYKISGLGEKNENTIVSLATIQMADYICFDIDSDNTNELLYFYFGSDNANQAFNTRLLDYDIKSETFLPVSDISLKQQISSVLNISVNKHKSEYSVLVDSLLNDGMYYTEIISYDSELSVLSLPEDESGPVAARTLRSSSVLCTDFNGDGLIDIPLPLNHDESYFVGKTDTIQSQALFLEWITYSPDEIREFGKFFENSFEGYRMRIDKLFEHYYFVYDYSSKLLQVCLKNLDEENNVVFTVECENSNRNDVFDSDEIEFDISVTSKGEAMNITENFVKDLISY